MSQEYEKCFLGVEVPDGDPKSIAMALVYAIRDYSMWKIRVHLMSGIHPQLTLYYMGRMGRTELNKASRSLHKNAKILKDTTLTIDGLKLLGEGDLQALVFNVRARNELKRIRRLFEDDLSEYLVKNLPFKPHITIDEIRSTELRARAEKLTQRKRPIKGSFVPEKIVLYGRIPGKKVEHLDEVKI